MTRLILAAILLISAAVILLTHDAQASGRYLLSKIFCDDKASVIKRLKEEYGEREKFIGTFPNSGAMSIYVNDVKKTYSIVMATGGTACLVGAGENWKALTVGDDA